MEIVLNRNTKTDKSTIGDLSINGKFECFTLEDVERDKKVYGKTAIPKGRYEVTLTMSNRFKKVLPLINNVPGFEGIRIHSGNTAEHTEGCVLLGITKSTDFVGNSKMAMSRLMTKLEAAAKKEKIFITIS